MITMQFRALMSRIRSFAGQPVKEQDDNDDPRVAFSVTDPDGRVLQALYPTRTRHARIEMEAVVFVQVFRDFDRAMRYVELHGATRAEFGSKFNLWPVSIGGRRDDDLIVEAIANARDLMHALRNPVEVPVIPDEFDQTVDDVTSAAEPAPVRTPDAAVALPAVVRQPIAEMVREGRFVFAGPMNWRGKDGKVGRPSFAAVIQHQPDGKEEKLYGSDLSRAITESGAKPGDIVRLTKFPRMPVQVGNRMVQKNIWTCDIVESAGVAMAA